MLVMLVNIPYGKSFLQTDISIERLEIATSQSVETLKNLKETVKQSLKRPINSQPLHLILGKGKKICVIIPDETRGCPTKEILSPVLQEIESCKPNKIELLIGNGLHRGMSKEEMMESLGKNIVKKYNVTNHSATDERQLIDLKKKTSYGTPGILNKIAVESDFVLGIGLVEPHFFAGFSGGRKTILPAIAGKEAILNNHSYNMIKSPYASYGKMKGNPIHHDMIEFMNFVNLPFIINISINKKMETTQIFAGDPYEAHEQAVKFVNTYGKVRIHGAPDIVIVSNGGYPLDRDLYQSVKGIATASNVVTEKGVIIMVAKCKDGLGGHKEFMKLMQKGTSPGEVLKEIKEEEPIVDQWQAQILSKILIKTNVIVVTDGVKRNIIEKMMMSQVFSLEEALDSAREMVLTDKPRILVIPEGPYIMPYF
jgi:nickel-dependent lactate racemase